jgi:integrase
MVRSYSKTMPTKVETTHELMRKELVIYRRERSEIWQCRYKVAGIWQRASTKQRRFEEAKTRAKEIFFEAEIRNRSNLPVITRRFKDIAKLAIERMEQELSAGKGKVIYRDYIRVITDYIIPSLGNRMITNIDYAALEQFDQDRIALMGKEPTSSTLHTQNAAMNRVFDEAVIRGFLTEANRPKLTASSGKKSDRRPAFELHELKALLSNLDAWIGAARNQASRERREIMRDYIEMLVDTGARPGIELLDIKWKQIRFMHDPTVTPTGEVDEYGKPIELCNLNRSCELTVTGKTGTRQIIGRQPTVKVLERIARRNYGVESSMIDPLKELIGPTNEDYVFRTKKDKKDVSEAFQKMFMCFLEDHNLLMDPKTEQKRVFYSLRHTYATLALTHDKVPIHTLAKQMGTSVVMIERHYSHLKVIQAAAQLRGVETRRLIEADSKVSPSYQSKKRGKRELVEA